MSAGRRRTLLTIALAAAGTAVAVVLIGQAAHFADLVTRLRGIRPEWLVLCAFGELAAYAGFIASYQAMAELAGGPRLPVGTVTRVVGLSFGAFSVATAIGGLSVDFWALREAGEPAKLASARVIALETMRWALLSLATCLAAILALLGVGRDVGWVVPVAWLVLVPACFGAGLWISSARHRARFADATRGRVRLALAIAVTGLVLIRKLLATPGFRARAIAGAALFWVGELLCAWAALRAFGTEAGIAALLLGYTTGYLSTGLPLPAGGSGSVDAAMTGGFVLAGAPLGTALLATIVFRVFSFWVPAIGALLSAATLRSLRARLRLIAGSRTAGALSASSPPVGHAGSVPRHQA